MTLSTLPLIGSFHQTPGLFDLLTVPKETVSVGDLVKQYEQRREEVRERVSSASALLISPTSPVVLPSSSTKHVTRNMEPQSFEDRLFDSLVSLKVAVSRYAMHLSNVERHRLFAVLDGLLNTDDWYEEDMLPRPASFTNFLKWMVYARNFDWESLGVSDEGTILVGWLTRRVHLTGNFYEDERVAWTSRVKSHTGVEYAAGTSSLQYFSKQSQFYLSENGEG